MVFLPDVAAYTKQRQPFQNFGFVVSHLVSLEYIVEVRRGPTAFAIDHTASTDQKNPKNIELSFRCILALLKCHPASHGLSPKGFFSPILFRISCTCLVTEKD